MVEAGGMMPFLASGTLTEREHTCQYLQLMKGGTFTYTYRDTLVLHHLHDHIENISYLRNYFVIKICTHDTHIMKEYDKFGKLAKINFCNDKVFYG